MFIPTDVLNIIETFTQDRIFGIYPKTREDYNNIMLLVDKKIHKWGLEDSTGHRDKDPEIDVVKECYSHRDTNDGVDKESSKIFNELVYELTNEKGEFYRKKLRNTWNDSKFKYVTESNISWIVSCDQPRLLQNVISEKVSHVSTSRNAKKYDISPEFGRIPFYRKRKLVASQILIFKVTFSYEKRIEHEYYREHVSVVFKHYKPPITMNKLRKKLSY